MRAGTGRGKIPERTAPYTSPQPSNAEANFRRRNFQSIGNKMLRLHEISSCPTFLVQLDFFGALAGVVLPNGGYEPGDRTSANPASLAFGQRLMEAINTPAMVRLAEMAVASAPGFEDRFRHLPNGVPDGLFRYIQYPSFRSDTAGFTRADEYLAYADALSAADIGPPRDPVPAAETGPGQPSVPVHEPAATTPDASAELGASAPSPTRAEVLAAIRSDVRAQDPFQLNSSPRYSTFGRGAHHLNVHDVAALARQVHQIHSSTSLQPPLPPLPPGRSKDVFVDWLYTNLPRTWNAVVWQALFDANIPARKWQILCAVPHPLSQQLAARSEDSWLQEFTRHRSKRKDVRSNSGSAGPNSTILSTTVSVENAASALLGLHLATARALVDRDTVGRAPDDALFDDGPFGRPPPTNTASATVSFAGVNATALATSTFMADPQAARSAFGRPPESTMSSSSFSYGGVNATVTARSTPAAKSTLSAGRARTPAAAAAAADSRTDRGEDGDDADGEQDDTDGEQDDADDEQHDADDEQHDADDEQHDTDGNQAPLLTIPVHAAAPAPAARVPAVPPGAAADVVNEYEPPLKDRRGERDFDDVPLVLRDLSPASVRELAARFGFKMCKDGRQPAPQWARDLVKSQRARLKKHELVPPPTPPPLPAQDAPRPRRQAMRAGHALLENRAGPPPPPPPSSPPPPPPPAQDAPRPRHKAMRAGHALPPSSPPPPPPLAQDAPRPRQFAKRTGPPLPPLESNRTKRARHH